MIPGRTLHRFAVHLCTPTTLERVVEPAIADLQKEYAETASTEQTRRAQVLMTGYVAITKVIVMCALNLSATSDDERRAIVRTIVWSFTLTVVFTAALMLPPLSIADGDFSSVFIAGLIPQAMPLATPIGLTFGIAIGLGHRPANRRVAKIVLLCALLASLVSFVTLAWVMPAGNQAYRESIARTAGITGDLIKGTNEMSLSELDRQAAIASAAGNMKGAGGYAWSFHLRFALSAASLVLAGFLLAIAGRSVATRALISLVACFAYWGLILVGEGVAIYSPVAPAFAEIPVAAGAWLPNIVFATTALFMASSSSSRLRGQRGAAQ